MASAPPQAREPQVHRARECAVQLIFYSISRVVEFPAGSATPSDATVIQQLAETLKHQRRGVEVEGHSDPSETQPQLSELRAKQVVELLVQHGVVPKQLILVDKGASPAPAGIERNSRVTFRVRNDIVIGCD